MVSHALYSTAVKRVKGSLRSWYGIIDNRPVRTCAPRHDASTRDRFILFPRHRAWYKRAAQSASSGTESSPFPCPVLYAVHLCIMLHYDTSTQTYKQAHTHICCVFCLVYMHYSQYRGDSLTEQKGEVTASAWMDRRVVTVMSTSTQPSATGTVASKQRDGSTSRALKRSSPIMNLWEE